MGGAGISARQRAAAAAARAYLDGPFRALPAGRRVGPRLGGALVLVTGGRALDADGAAGAEPWSLEVVLGAEEWARLEADSRPSELCVEDPSTEPATGVRIRGAGWLRARLAEPAGLWLRQRAAVVQDPAGLLPPAIAQALDAFRQGLGEQVRASYRAFREGFETAGAARDPLGRAVLLGRAAEAALALPLLARGEPYPPPQWLVWQLRRVWPEGDELAALAGRAAAGSAGTGPGGREAYAALRRLVDDALEQAGYGESVVRVYRRWA